MKTRYEEYSRFGENLPFKLLPEMTIPSVKHHKVPNWHDNIEIQFCHDGNGGITLDDRVVFFDAGDTVVINSNVLHRTFSEGTARIACLIIDTSFCRSVGFDPVSLCFSEKIRSKFFTESFQNLVKLYRNTDDDCRIAKMSSIVLNMLIELRENHTIQTNMMAMKSKYFGIVKDTIKFIRKNYGKKLTLDIIAKNILVNQYTLSREFKKATGQTIIQYLILYRCQRASDLIFEGMSVSEAATACGFDNMSFFTRTFKSNMGCLPSKYKKL